MLTGFTIPRAAILLALVLALAIAACQSEPSAPTEAPRAPAQAASPAATAAAPTPTPMPTPMPTPTPQPYLTTSIAPCTPVEGSTQNPCVPREPAGQTVALHYELTPPPRPLERWMGIGFKWPSAAGHIVLRATYLPDTLRCNQDSMTYRPPPYLSDETLERWSKYREVSCFINIRANEYLVGKGPTSLTVIRRTAFTFNAYAYDNWTHWEESFRPLLGTEEVLFLAPAVNHLNQMWEVIGSWGLERQGGSVVVVHPLRDEWKQEDIDTYNTYRTSLLEIPLADFKTKVQALHTKRVQDNGGRVAPANFTGDLATGKQWPMLVTDANKLADYMEAVGADTHPDGAPVTTFPPLYVDAPGSVTVYPPTDGFVGLVWESVTGATAYAIEALLEGDHEWQHIADGVAETIYRVPETLLLCTETYRFRVGAYGDHETSNRRIPGWGWTTSGSMVMNHCINQAPVFDETAYSFTISEGAVAGDVVGTVSAFDRNGDDLTFSVTGADSSTFGVDADTGEILVAANRLGLGSKGTEYTVTVKASDGSLSDTATVTITATAWGCVGKAVYGDIYTKMIEDCETMLLFRDRLAGTASLPWSDQRHMESPWAGVEVAWSDEYPEVRVTEILLEDMGLNGVLPAEIGDVDGLHLLDLSDNDLTGGIPEEIDSLNRLTRLALADNALTGGIPEEIGSMSRLTLLNLSDNDLTGPIPWQLGGLDNLELLHLSGNSFTGCIPPGLEAITDNDLDQIDMRTCTYDGRIPAPTGLGATAAGDGAAMNLSWSAVGAAHYDVEARVNRDAAWETLAEATTSTGAAYSGAKCGHDFEFRVRAYADGVAYTPAWSEWARSEPLVAAVGDCAVLLGAKETLEGDGDVRLNWSASLSVSEWDGVSMDRIFDGRNDRGQVVILDLAWDGLAGTIPAALGDLAGLQQLLLAQNSFTGTVPEELGRLSNLTILSVGNNSLSGSLPDSLGNLTSLEHLWASQNGFTGEIPAALGRLTKVIRLNLGNNEFTGAIPEELADMSALRYLSIYPNDGLTGCVPAALKDVENHDLGVLELPDCAEEQEE